LSARAASRLAWSLNPSENEQLRIVSEVRPALHMEALIEGGFGLARDLKTGRRNVPKRLLRMIVLANEAKCEFYVTAVPRPVRGAFSLLLRALAYVVGRLGYGGER
jgi:hypothetical protein